MRRAILLLPTKLLKELLQLPDGSVIEHAFVESDVPDIINLRITNIGFDVPDGSRIITTNPVVVRNEEHIYFDWSHYDF